MRIRSALILSGMVAIAHTMPISVNAGAIPTPTPSATPSTLPIGNVGVQITSPGAPPQGATHVEHPPF
ncbi:MAG: hypothetical protein HY692_04765 [Cyanobacteria bacterium NC_groundwater_1444_Ag_S-0.65um_54_12]|nr:hypothetical protein [Cyanobacteria bacterium NC_groundwater_1444_Ag_S-0.65um_54_12]